MRRGDRSMSVTSVAVDFAVRCVVCEEELQPVDDSAHKGVMRDPNGACKATREQAGSYHADLRCKKCGGADFLPLGLNGIGLESKMMCNHCTQSIIISVPLPDLAERIRPQRNA